VYVAVPSVAQFGPAADQMCRQMAPHLCLQHDRDGVQCLQTTDHIHLADCFGHLGRVQTTQISTHIALDHHGERRTRPEGRTLEELRNGSEPAAIAPKEPLDHPTGVGFDAQSPQSVIMHAQFIPIHVIGDYTGGLVDNFKSDCFLFAVYSLLQSFLFTLQFAWAKGNAGNATAKLR